MHRIYFGHVDSILIRFYKIHLLCNSSGATLICTDLMDYIIHTVTHTFIWAERFSKMLSFLLLSLCCSILLLLLFVLPFLLVLFYNCLFCCCCFRCCCLHCCFCCWFNCSCCCCFCLCLLLYWFCCYCLFLYEDNYKFVRELGLQ